MKQHNSRTLIIFWSGSVSTQISIQMRSCGMTNVPPVVHVLQVLSTAIASACLRLLLKKTKIDQAGIKKQLHLLFPPLFCLFNGCVQLRWKSPLFVFYLLRNIELFLYLWIWWISNHISWEIYAENQEIELKNAFTFFSATVCSLHSRWETWCGPWHNTISRGNKLELQS